MIPRGGELYTESEGGGFMWDVFWHMANGIILITWSLNRDIQFPQIGFTSQRLRQAPEIAYTPLLLGMFSVAVGFVKLALL